MNSRVSASPDPESAAAVSDAASALRADAAAAVAALGDAAGIMVPIGSLEYYGSRLGWPDWLYAGSSLAGLGGPPPPQIRADDDLIISANLFAYVGAAALLDQSIHARQPTGGPISRLAFSNAPTLGAIFGFLQRVMQLSGPYCRPVTGTSDDRVFVGLADEVPLGGLLDHFGLLFIAFHYRVVSELVSGADGDTTISLTIPEGRASAAIRQLFRCDVCFGAASNRLSVPAAWLGLPNPDHDAFLWALAEERLRVSEARFQDSETLRRVRRRIADMLRVHRKAPRLKQVAQAEGISTRSLVRHVAAAGHSFHGLVDQERRLRTSMLISDPDWSLRAIADELGFPDVSGFGRKFRTWFGDSPGRFRRSGN